MKTKKTNSIKKPEASSKLAESSKETKKAPCSKK